MSVLDGSATADLVERMASHEGFRPFVYDDATGRAIMPGTLVKGWPTIGYGWNLAARPMTTGGAREILLRQVLEEMAAIGREWTDEERAAMGPARVSVLVEMRFNLGAGKLPRFVRTLAAVRAGRYTEAAARMRKTLWARQVGARAERLARIMETGRWR